MRSKACAIGLMFMVVITGGWNLDLHEPMGRVVMYNTGGSIQRLPDLLTARAEHACGHYVNSNNAVVRIQQLNDKWSYICTVRRFW